MTTLVTGASGHIGVNLVHALISRGRKVRAFVHKNQQPLDELDIELVQGDIRDTESLYNACQDVEVVYHLAGLITIMRNEWPAIEAINVTGTRNVVEACLRSGVRRLVHFSSIHALTQKPMNMPVDESRPPAESGDCPVYDRSKAAGEKEVRRGIERGLNAVILYPTGVIGPYDYQTSYLGEALMALADGTVPSLVPGGFDWVDARDVAEGAIQAELQAPAGARYLLSGHWVSLPDMARLISEITRVPAPGFICPMWLARIGVPLMMARARWLKKRPLYTADSLRALCSNRHISHEKATRELGYQPRPFSETITDTLRWFADNGRLRKPLRQIEEP